MVTKKENNKLDVNFTMGKSEKLYKQWIASKLQDQMVFMLFSISKCGMNYKIRYFLSFKIFIVVDIFYEDKPHQHLLDTQPYTSHVCI